MAADINEVRTALQSRAAADWMMERKRGCRWAVLLVSLGLVLAIPTGIGSWMGLRFSSWILAYILGSAGFSVGVFTALKLFPRFWIVVPQSMAFVTTNLFTSRGDNPNIPYGPGGHPCFPWELREESGNISLDTMTLSFVEEVPTTTSAVIVTGSIQFNFSPTSITDVVGIDIEIIEQGFVDQVKEWLSDYLGKKEGDWAKKNVSLVRQTLQNEFQDLNGDTARKLLEEYVIIVTGVKISGIDFKPDVQKARDAADELARVNDVIWKLLGFADQTSFNAAVANKDITQQDIARARDDFMAASGNAKKEIRRVDVTGVNNMTGAVAAGFLGDDRK